MGAEGWLDRIIPPMNTINNLIIAATAGQRTLPAP